MWKRCYWLPFSCLLYLLTKYCNFESSTFTSLPKRIPLISSPAFSWKATGWFNPPFPCDVIPFPLHFAVFRLHRRNIFISGTGKSIGFSISSLLLSFFLPNGFFVVVSLFLLVCLFSLWASRHFSIMILNSIFPLSNTMHPWFLLPAPPQHLCQVRSVSLPSQGTSSKHCFQFSSESLSSPSVHYPGGFHVALSWTQRIWNSPTLYDNLHFSILVCLHFRITPPIFNNLCKE